MDNQEGGQGRVRPDIRPLPGNQLSQQIGGRWAPSLPLLLAAGRVALEALLSLSGPQSHLQMGVVISILRLLRHVNEKVQTGPKVHCLEVACP